MIDISLRPTVASAKRAVRLAGAYPVLKAAESEAELQRVHAGYYFAFPLSLMTRPLASLPRLLGGPSRFRHRTQRPTTLYLPGLEAKPWWPADDLAKTLEANWECVAEEFARIQHEVARHPQSYLVTSGDWSIFTLFQGFAKVERNCALCPRTTEIVESLPLCTNVAGLVYFSIMKPGTVVKPHFGPVNTRLRYHLTLHDDPGAEIRVGGERRSWKAGQCLVFDDSFEHEVAHHGSSPRVVLLLDCWHPSLTAQERDFLDRLYRCLAGIKA